MFFDPKVLPQSIRRIHLFFTSPLKSEVFSETLVGRAMKRLKFERRLHPNVLTGVMDKAQQEQVAKRWHDVLSSVYKNQTDGFVWLRQDVVVEDYFLVDRLTEAWTYQDSVVMYDEQGRLIFWAMCARGVKNWLKAHAQATKQTIQNNQMPELPELKGQFPDNYFVHSTKFELKQNQWPICMSTVSDIAAVGEREHIMDAERAPIKIDLPANLPPLLVVCATRVAPEQFKTHTATGRSLERMKSYGVPVQAQVVCENSNSLSSIFNRAIDVKFIDHIVIFMHDDVWIDDVFIGVHVFEALQRFDVVGVAGSRNRILKQPSWMHPRSINVRDDVENLLGCVAHDIPNNAHSKDRNWVSEYGAKRGAARLLDGVLIATTVRALLQSNVRFDTRFAFHFYDLDFCMVAENAGLRLGVWPLAISHCSGGNFKSTSWYAAYGTYSSKWQKYQ